MQDIAFSFVHNGATCKGLAIVLETDRQGHPALMDFIINSRFAGTIRLANKSWEIESTGDKLLMQKALQATSPQMFPSALSAAA